MKHGLMLSMVLLCGLAIILAGCSSTSNSTDNSGGSATSSVKTMDEYRTEAARAITTDNAEAELNRLEQEINADN